MQRGWYHATMLRLEAPKHNTLASVTEREGGSSAHPKSLWAEFLIDEAVTEIASKQRASPCVFAGSRTPPCFWSDMLRERVVSACLLPSTLGKGHKVQSKGGRASVVG